MRTRGYFQNGNNHNKLKNVNIKAGEKHGKCEFFMAGI